MNYPHHGQSLSPLELVVLARISSSKAPGTKELAEAVRDFAPPIGSPEKVDESIAGALATLRRRALVEARRARLTADGQCVLRTAFELERKPTWRAIRAQLPARGLALQPDSDEARHALKNRETVVFAVLRELANFPRGSTLTAVCDALIADRLGLSGPVTLKRLRAHVLVQHLKNEPRLGNKASSSLDQLAATMLNEAKTDKRSLMKALGRRWFSQLSTRKLLPITTVPVALAQGTAPDPQPPIVVPLPTGDHTLLSLVREAIPRIGSDGRFGAEKVFVSAIWRDISRDRRASALSLEYFKRWLVTANREQLLNLARADLVGAMDAKLVAESEIEDLGATFHFVLDSKARAVPAGRGNHAR